MKRLKELTALVIAITGLVAALSGFTTTKAAQRKDYQEIAVTFGDHAEDIYYLRQELKALKVRIKTLEARLVED